jgi:hypothetical protein
VADSEVVSPYERVLARLTNVKRQPAGGAMAKCPCHDDTTASVKVDETPDGGALVYDHGGCPTEKILAEIGLEMTDLFPHKNGRPLKPVKIVATYDYRNERGALVYQVVRLDPNTSQRLKNLIARSSRISRNLARRRGSERCQRCPRIHREPPELAVKSWRTLLREMNIERRSGFRSSLLHGRRGSAPRRCALFTLSVDLGGMRRAARHRIGRSIAANGAVREVEGRPNADP